MTRLRVLQSFPAPRPTTNPYIIMLDRALAACDGIDHERFDWRLALLGRYDAIHLHWPETLFNSATPLNRAVKRLLVAALVARLRVSRIAVVRTVHNLHLPADVSPFQRRLLARIERLATLRIRIGETTELPEHAAVETILHGDYRPWFRDLPRAEATRGRLAFVGLVRRYKGVERLLEAFRDVPAEAGLTLAVSGSPTSDSIADEVRHLAGGDPRVELDLRFLDDAGFVAAMTAAELVVLPYRHMHNSGSVLAALSLERPVLVPRNAANEALADEVGPGWVHLFDGELDAAVLERAARAVREGLRDAEPDLSRRTWDDVGSRHAAAFARAVELRRARA